MLKFGTLKLGSDQVYGQEIGNILVVRSDDGIAMLLVGTDLKTMYDRMESHFAGQVLCADQDAVADDLTGVLAVLSGAAPESDLPFEYDLQGTDFQQKVWSALAQIPYGQTRTYQEIAIQIGQPTAARAVGTACGANPVVLLVPCHRVLPASGEVGNYSCGGPAIKHFLLGHEESMQWKHLTDLATVAGSATMRPSIDKAVA